MGRFDEDAVRAAIQRGMAHVWKRELPHVVVSVAETSDVRGRFLARVATVDGDRSLERFAARKEQALFELMREQVYPVVYAAYEGYRTSLFTIVDLLQRMGP